SLAGMSSIDPQLPEAARIDGANQFQVLRHVFVPCLRMVMEIVLVTSTINAFASMFTYVFAITNGGPGFSTFVVEFDMYNNAFAFQRLGYACAMGLLLTVLISGLGFLQIRALSGGSEWGTAGCDPRRCAGRWCSGWLHSGCVPLSDCC